MGSLQMRFAKVGAHHKRPRPGTLALYEEPVWLQNKKHSIAQSTVFVHL
jgi:hypothetical protein